jgi:serine/threonine protein kinase
MNLILKDIVHRDLKLENILIKEFDANSDTFLIKVGHY